MNQFITELLAKLLEKFKMKNPAIYAAVIVVLLAAIYFAQQGTAFGLFSLPAWLASIVQYAATILGMLTSSQTYRFLPSALQAKRNKLQPAAKPEREPG